jgi:hypothetical protein
VNGPCSCSPDPSAETPPTNAWSINDPAALAAPAMADVQSPTEVPAAAAPAATAVMSGDSDGPLVESIAMGVIAIANAARATDGAKRALPRGSKAANAALHENAPANALGYTSVAEETRDRGAYGKE